MKTKNLFLFTALSLLSVGQVPAQIFTTLHHFSGGGGASSFGGLVLSSNTLYGTTFAAPDDSGLAYGTVFAVSTQGTGFTNLHNFVSGPFAGLILSGNTLYGTTLWSDSTDSGTVFKVNTDGTGYTNLYSFTPVVGPGYGPRRNADGAQPEAGLILSGPTLYGTASIGGSSGIGTVFAVSTNGTSFTNLHSFTGSSGDGAYPQAGLILSGNTLYGTAPYGGSSGNGTVFALNTNGTGFTILHSFTGTHTNSSSVYTNSDGAGPQAGLILSGNTLYGTASGGGSSGNGTVFSVQTDGTGFTNLHSFTAFNPPTFTNSGGASPNTPLVLSGGTLYGTTFRGGSSGGGTVFAIKTNGTDFTNLHSFTATSGSAPYGNSDGTIPRGGLTLSGNTLYGTTAYGGSSGRGTVFSLSLPLPPLTIVRSGANVILSWPANVAGFDSTRYSLQSTTNLVSPVVWSTNSLAPVVIAGRNTVTNPITGARQFYRLIQ